MLNNPIQVLKQSELLGHQFTVYGTPENPLFLAKEIAECIDYDKSSLNKLVASVDDDEKVRNIIPTPGGNQQVWMLTEDGLYEVLMQSRKPIAKQFKKGVKQILHEVRTQGGYIVTRQEETDEEIMAKALSIAQRTIAKREERIKQLETDNQRQQVLIKQKDEEAKENAPKVLFANAVSTSHRSCLVAELAKILQQNGVNIGQNRLFAWMHENGYLCSKGQYYNQPTQKAMELGLFELKQTSITKPDGTVLVTTTTKVTGKGQVHFVNKFLGNAA